MDTADGKLVLPSLSVRLCSRFWQAPMLPWLVRGRRLLMGTARGKLVLPWLSVRLCSRFWQAPMLPWLVRGRRLMAAADGKLRCCRGWSGGGGCRCSLLCEARTAVVVGAALQSLLASSMLPW